MGKSLFTLLILVPALFAGSRTGNTGELFQAIRNDNIELIRNNLTKENLDARDTRGATLLMQAAAYGSLDMMKMLVDAGVDINAKNHFDATALLWCARNAGKARFLIEHGADVNARSKQGRTPLMLASMVDGGPDIVALMLAKGAGVNVTDTRGETALGLASETGDVRTMRLLISKGANVNAPDIKGITPIIHAAVSASPDAVRLLIEKGADVNAATTWYPKVRNGQIALLELTALHHAAGSGDLELVRCLLKAGAKVNFKDSRGFGALAFAVAADRQNPAIVRALIDAGADVNAATKIGETPLDWAEKFNFPEVIAVLKKSGAEHGSTFTAPKPPATRAPDAATALERSTTLMQKSSAEFFKQSGCVGCHHQPMMARAQRLAGSAGIHQDEAAAQEQLLQLKSQWTASQEEFLQALNPGGGSNRLGENLLGLEAAGYPADTMTDSAVVDLAEFQAADGTWPSGEAHARPPITEGMIGSTARAIRALQVYAIPARKAEFAARIARARAWLLEAQPASTDDFAMQLLGLAWAGAEKSHVQQAAHKLLALQREDGGWAGNPYLKSDAFSTGQALHALHESGSLGPSSRNYKRGVEFLLSTQYPDGSWYVRSRSIKFQPYFDSGFPFGHDQWISAAATAWASMALAPAVKPN